MGSSTSTARLAGLLWLLTAVTGGFGLFTIRSRVIVPGDAAATAANIMASESLYRAAIVSTLISQVLLFFLGLTLFRLFREVDRRLATVLLASVMMTVGLAVMNTLNHFEALMLLSQAEFLKKFTPPQLDVLAMVSVRLANGSGQGLVEIVWAPYYVSFG
jgi:predicted benzoate:H+ symporter BenE